MAADTIFALATPPGRSGVAVMRLSGTQAGAIVDATITGRRPPPDMPPCDKFRTETAR